MALISDFYPLIYILLKAIDKLQYFLSAEMEIKSAKASDSGLWACMSQKDEDIGEQILDHGRLLVIPRFVTISSDCQICLKTFQFEDCEN